MEAPSLPWLRVHRTVRWRTGHVTIHCPVHRIDLLFTVLCTGQSNYSLSYAPNRVTILCPVHRTCYYSLSCAPDNYYSLSCAPANSTLSDFSSVYSPFDFNFWEDFPEKLSCSSPSFSVSPPAELRMVLSLQKELETKPKHQTCSKRCMQNG